MFRSVLIAMSLILVPIAAEANSCGERDQILDVLASKYHESPVGMGITSDGQFLEVVASEEGTWTILATAPNGPTCPIAVGEAWRKVAPSMKQEDGRIS